MKNFCIILLSILLFATSIHAEIIYKEATKNDISGILELYKNMPKEAKHALFLLPTLDMQKNVILENIEKKRLIVAVDKNTIIGFAKNYIIDNSKELGETLQEELNIDPEQCLDYKTYSIGKYQNCFKQFPAPIQHNTSNLEVLKNCLPQKDSSLFIYTGAYYTHPDYRGKGINTQLCLYQLETIFKTIKERMQKEKITHVALLYGQVLANTKHVGMVKEFAYCLQSLLASDFTLHHYLFKATKPEFKEINGEFKIVFLPENEGRGSIVIAKITDKKVGGDELL